MTAARKIMDEHPAIVIVGAGCFGISTAFHLLKRGYKTVTVLDRASVLPAPDAASTDINKVVRSAYDDRFYAELGKRAIASWKTDFDNVYHESGVLVVGETDDASSYARLSYKNDQAMGARVEVYDSQSVIFPRDVQVNTIENGFAYLNKDGGWAFAAEGVRQMIEKVRALGGKVIPNKSVHELVRRDGVTRAVKTSDGDEYPADLVVLAAGSWTASAFQQLDFEGRCIATGQSLATIQLTPEEAKRYKDCPVILNVSSGFYMFPPNEDDIVKCAIHDSGYVRPLQSDSSSSTFISTPRTSTSHAADGLRIPQEMVKRLRDHLKKIYPELGEKPFSGTRLCWYNDAPDDDWIIGRYPTDENIVIATAGSGHAYKFLPVIGEVISDIIENKATPDVVKRFAIDRPPPVSNLWGRPSAVKELREEQLCQSQDLQA